MASGAGTKIVVSDLLTGWKEGVVDGMGGWKRRGRLGLRLDRQQAPPGNGPGALVDLFQ